GEQVAAMGEHVFLDAVLGAARCKQRLTDLLIVEQFLAEPGHGPVQVVELQGVSAHDRVVGLPLVSSAITAEMDRAVQRSEEDGPLDVEAEAASFQKLVDDLLAAGQLPEPLEDKHWPDMVTGDGDQLSLGVRHQQEDVAAQACARDQEAVKLS